MAMIDVSRQRRSLLRDATAINHLPFQILATIQDPSSTKLLDAIAEAALHPLLTERIFVHFEDVFADICARWTLEARNEAGNGPRALRVASAMARILPFAPYLSVFLRCQELELESERPSLRLFLPKLDTTTTTTTTRDLLQSLLVYWRLLSFDLRTFGPLVSPALAQRLFSHPDRAVRYLAIRVFCQLLHASDHKVETLIEAHVGTTDAIVADFDGVPADYGFLSLHERARAKRVLTLRQEVTRWQGEPGPDADAADAQPCLQSPTPYVVSYGETILPRPSVPTSDPSTLVMTTTTTKNLERLAAMLRNPEPILLHGLPGVGKTALVHEMAKQLGTHANMVTLHLNEQTDAKMLIGLYSTDSTPGSFSWRPGVLTTAVKEGRWVLVEDLDRAPTEVLSTFLPLIERNELLIPSRGERIRAANSFRLFATVRTSRGMNGRENLPSIVGMRFWQSLYTEPAAQAELQEIVLQSYPILRKFLPGILAVYGRLSRHSNVGLLPGRGRGRGLTDRPLSLRDLLKWCRRLKECLLAGGSVSGEEPISESTRDFMFMEAVDCFVGGCPVEELSRQLVYAIAEEMHLSRERADHYLTANIPPLEENDAQFRIGRVQLPKRKLSRMVRKSQRPFASTLHAKKLLEQIAVAVKLNEPVLLVGETGIGKTTVVQQLAESLGHKLIAVNLSQQSEVGDLLGGFKPVNVRSLAVPLKEEFEDLFSATGISASKNQKYLEQVGRQLAKGQWSKLAKLWREAPKMFSKILSELERAQAEQAEARNCNGDGDGDGDGQQPPKRRKTQSKYQTLLELKSRWDSFSRNLEQFEIQISGSGSGGFAFSFVEGNLVKAVRNGDWVLLDEINLASPDTLEGIVDLLTGPSEEPSLLLSETGEIEKIVAHPNFRIFGAMNPATDIGKRDLPIGIRSRFTELYVKSPDKDLKDLLTIIRTYLGNGNGNNSRQHDQAADDIARLYLNTKRMAEEKRLVDGANEVPHFSLRTLTRVLSYVNTISPFYGVRRALYEGFSMGFLTLLDRDSEKMLLPLIYHHLLDNKKHGNGGNNPQQLLSQPPKRPTDGKQYVRFQNQSRDRQYWLFQGEETPIERDDYIITPYVERNLLNLVRATSTRRFPILIQGPTSAGKTSMIEYLANFTGNKFVRINNHEHTDLQEYLGTYVSGADGKLRFQEGLLVQAMRQGHWIVLDELNLAPTDVLEALNRLLDDNRELLIPETQEIVRPHENFILFATQNPPGLYGGRKVLSRAFRNRFLELHFDDIPEDELEYILQQRSRNTSPPDCRRIVSVYKELSRLRQTSRVFEKKDSFATLRDLFRWALRDAETREEIAAHGFMLLAERVRNEEERVAVKEVIEKVFKVTLDPHELYSASVAPELKQFTQTSNSQGVVWTHAIRRLYVLVSRALRNNEPVLLVGETGCGKTTVVQLLAEAVKQELSIVNAHQNTETGDLIGSQRPIRNRGGIVETLEADLAEALKRCRLDASGPTTDLLARYKTIDASLRNELLPLDLRERISLNETRSKALFEWSDGALVQAMRSGHFFLLDEISLADDSVLERLNSVLEPQRTLLLAEKGIDNSFVKAAPGFQFFATMNPGGDFGKKELSPALRNRFTEIWVPPLSESDDIFDIVRQKLKLKQKQYVEAVVRFAAWFGKTFRPMATAPFSVREVLAWVQFINTFPENDPVVTIVHGAAAIFIDSLGANPSAMLATDVDAIQNQRRLCLEKLGELLGQDVSTIYETQPELAMSDIALGIGAFSTPRTASASSAPNFAFHAPTTRLNAMRVVRAMQTTKPILLEGSPGVGKTSLVVALAQACGRPLTRINLSDQTDLIDLFGTDVPVEGEEAGNFAWRDAPFLQAMQKGEWVLLDEMNLASQSVLEGLNACLDHRGEVYVSELDQVFKRHPDFRLFAAQNPHHQGGGRKGLPASFVNRFIVVYADVFKAEDSRLIASHSFPALDGGVIDSLIRFVSEMEHQLVVERSFGAQGGPWEFNLRDILRWLSMLSSDDDPVLKTRGVDDFLDIVVKQRFRTQRDRDEVDRLFTRILGSQPRGRHFYHDISSRFGQVGLALLERDADSQPERLPNMDIVSRFPELESMMLCVKLNIPCILSSPSGYGKSMLLEYVAALAGRRLVVFPMNADIDTMDLVGGFEQADPLREMNATIQALRDYLQVCVMALVPGQAPDQVLALLHQLDAYNGNSNTIPSIVTSIQTLLPQISQESEVSVKLSSALATLRAPLVLKNPRFEWLDGVIVKALESGQWLVLDNANMCNASVLDRLNSLLEPNGFLSINEHCGPGGEPRIVRPHPEFRIFLTTDPRYGELSRAMRNRAVEIHMHTPPPRMERCFGRMADVESGLQRYGRSLEASQTLLRSGVAGEACEVSLENLSMRDVGLLQRFANANTLIGEGGEAGEYRELVQGFVGFFASPAGTKTLQAVAQTYSKLSGSTLLSHDQPLHTLNNFTVSKLLPQVDEARWVAVCYETYRQLFAIQALLDRQESHARAAKLASLNRLQRSLISDRVAAVAKDTTVKLAPFVSATLNAMGQFLGADLDFGSGLDRWRERGRLVRMVVCYLDRTVALSTGQEFDEAVFQAHLAQGTAVLEKKIPSGCLDETSGRFAALVLGRLRDDFTSGFQLRTGLSMEPLWKMFRPIPLPDQSVLERTLDLNGLAARFDHLRWKVGGASIADLAKAQRTLEQAYGIVRDGLTSTSAEGLVQDLTAVIESLEARISSSHKEESDRLPWFAEEFEALRQLDLLCSITTMTCSSRVPVSSEATHELSIMSNVPTQARLNMLASCGKQGKQAKQAKQAKTLQAVDCLVHQGRFSWDGRLTASLWLKLQTMASVSLGSLALLDMELPGLGRYLVSLSAEVTADPVLKLDDVLWRLLLDVFGAHGQDIEATCSGRPLDSSLWDDFVQTLEPPHLRQIAVDHLIPCAVSLLAAKSNDPETTSKTSLSSLAWIHFAIGVLKLYVPDRVFDPYLRPKIEREYHLDLQTRLTDRISALVAFENSFTGQNTNERIELLNRELSEMGPLPEEVQPVFRPKPSELSRLQAEFSNILKAITSPGLEPALQLQASQDVQIHQNDGLVLVRENVKRLLDRLSSRFEAYQDMTSPAANLLQCLLVGLSLHDAATNAKGLPTATDRVLKLSPFLGGSSWDLSTGGVSDNSLEFLKLVHAAVAVEGDSLPPSTWEPVFRCFHALYDDWKRKLEEDRKAEEAKASLYHFRGSLEDEEEVDEQQFNELFPTYDADADVGSNSRHLVRDTSLQVAEVHRKLFLDRGDPADAIQELCKAMGSRVAGETKDEANLDRELNGKLLNSALLLLDDKISRLRPLAASTATENRSSSYNFYADANLPEARQLVDLIQQIKSRFRELQQVDEIGHMQPLEDVVQSCNRVLDLVNDDPLAKILPKVEALHGFVYEWQFGGWASKTYLDGVLSLHNLLTDTIIRWRRLELSTWANLFDTEMRKCADDADSWWFIAYQVVIAAPLSMVEASSSSLSELREYAVSLTKTLEQYFSGSIVGQFRARIALLRQFQRHLGFLVRDLYPALSVIHDALANFVGYFSRYEREVDAAIQRGRASLEKKMKDVLLMASWKDTNINALRESAKKSHLKLFRIVRKFRGILGQEMKPIIDRGLPDETLPLLLPQDDAQLRSVAIASQASVHVPKEAVAALNETLPGWLDTHKRLANAPKTISIMQKIFSSVSGISVTSILDSYLASLDASMAELRRETPSTLTDENKEQVKHLKTRKRKLFADTLREIRNMGVRYNLGQDTLAEQDSLAAVLASVSLLDTKNGNETLRRSEYYLHKVLCLVPKARAAAREHSEDLTGAEAVRSIGFVEGLLHLILSQRRSISTASGSLLLLQKSISQFRGLGDVRGLGNLARRRVAHDLPRLLPWALQGLKFAIHSLQVHGKLGSIDHDAMISQLRSWMDKFASDLTRLGQFSTPRPFTSSSQAQVEEQISNELQAFDRWVEEAIEGHADLAFILRQLRVWTRVSLEHLEVSTPTTPLLEFADQVSTLCDTILVAVESARKAGAGMPIKEDEAGWLTRHSDAHISMLNQLHMKNVTKAVGRCITVLQDVDLASLPTSTAAMSAIAVAAPILNQFSALCEQSLASSLDMYRATVQMGYSLTQSFITIASQGFCTPQEKSDETAGDSGKLETGTGLGDGEGAEDISKDIQPDEDLSELAQEANQEKNENMEDEKDAVDMADEDMEGDMGSVAGDEEDEKKGDEKEDEEEEEDKEMDEEAGEVDDLDPTAVDEKMWDGGDDDKAEKDQQGDKAKGQKQDDEQMATEGEAKGQEEGEQEQEPEANNNDDDNEPEADEEAGAEEEDVQAQEELNRQDQNVQEHDALELPEDLDMNIDEPETADGDDDDDLDLMSDIEKEEGEEEEGQADAAEAKDTEEEDAENADGPLEEAAAADEDVIESEGEPEEVDEKMGGDEVQENPAEEEEEEQGEGEAEKEEEQEQEQAQRPRQDDKADGQDAAPSDVKGSGQDQDADAAETDDFQARAAQQEDGEMGEGAADEDKSRGSKGASSREKPVGQQENDKEAEDAEEARKNPFKKLGDALEKWHRQQQDIKDAGDDGEKQQESEQKKPEAEAEGEMGRKEFQHLKDDEDAEDAQAMGKADREEVQPLDESMAVDEDDEDAKEDPGSRVMDVDGDDNDDGGEDEEVDKMDVEPKEEEEEEEDTGMDGDESRTGVQTRQGNYKEQETPEVEEEREDEEEEKKKINEDEEVEDTSAQLSTTHLHDQDQQRPLRDMSSCLEEWSTLQAKSHSLSLSLTSQLRLILTPSQSTKLSGSFRTGKRLNIKRIIPYIASSYKRDKIWMRRAIPTKRTYQILLCVDDSKSMGESRSGPLAMESLVMVSRSLTMLEAGQVGVLGFGADVFTAHPLAEPFGSGDAGAKVLQRFSFSQDRTDVERLLRTTVETFRAGRQQNSGGSGGAADLWQLALILSDGLTPSSAHEGIRRLLREAAEERIMVVFIIMDDGGKKRGDSVLELKEARFVRDEGEGGGSRVVIERYLDGFPFQYYLIVHQMEELPSALAGLLRTWFAEVAA